MADSSSDNEAVCAPSPKPKKKYISLNDKLGYCIEAEKVVNAEKTQSLKKFCKERGFQPSQLRRWQKRMVEMKKALERTRKKKTVKACTHGRPSRLDKIHDKLMPWVEAMIADGKIASVRQTASQAKKHDRSLRRMDRYSLFQICRRWLRRHGITDRAVTHQSQEDPRGKESTATAFLTSTRPLLQQRNRSQAFILNMDQTPYNCGKDTAKRTLAYKGSKTVNAKTVKTSIGRISVLLCVAANGTKLPPLLVYKGKPGGSIEKELRNAAHYPKDAKYIVQQNAWTDERVMLFWVENILAPYVKTAPEGVVPYLLLDKYTCHYQGSVAKAMEDLGVEWDILPGGCTGLIQPVDVGINRPWKYRLRNRLEEYMAARDNSDRLSTKTTRRMIAKWAVESWDRTTEDVVYNAWRHTPFSYFPTEPSQPTAFENDENLYSSEEEEEEEEEEGEEEKEEGENSAEESDGESDESFCGQKRYYEALESDSDSNCSRNKKKAAV
jgi:hypothetical protein